MSEGGTYPWRRQKLTIAPTLNYKNALTQELVAPQGKRWHYDPANKHWSLVVDDNDDTTHLISTTTVRVSSPSTVMAVVDAEIDVTNYEKENNCNNGEEDLLVAESSVSPSSDDEKHCDESNDTEIIDISTIAVTVDAIPINNNNKENCDTIIDAGTATSMTTPMTTDDSSSSSSSQYYYKTLTEKDMIDIVWKECGDAGPSATERTTTCTMTRAEVVAQLKKHQWNVPIAIESIKIQCLLQHVLNHCNSSSGSRRTALHPTEAKAYLMLNDWNVQAAFNEAKYDEDHNDEAHYYVIE